MDREEERRRLTSGAKNSITPSIINVPVMNGLAIPSAYTHSGTRPSFPPASLPTLKRATTSSTQTAPNIGNALTNNNAALPALNTTWTLRAMSDWRAMVARRRARSCVGGRIARGRREPGGWVSKQCIERLGRGGKGEQRKAGEQGKVGLKTESNRHQTTNQKQQQAHTTPPRNTHF